MKISTELLLSVGAKEVWPPAKLLKRHFLGNGFEDAGVQKAKRLLVAIVHTHFGQHFKEINSISRFLEVKHSPMAVEYFELTRHGVETLKAALQAQQNNVLSCTCDHPQELIDGKCELCGGVIN